MKKNTKLFLVFMFNLTLLNVRGMAMDKIEHDHCPRIGNFCHHLTSGTACLRHNTKLSKDDLSHFIKCHLGNDIYRLDFSLQDNLNSDTLKVLANTDNAGAIRFLDVMSTNATYNGIVALWNSSTFGSLVADSPTYERHTGVPVSIIEIEIGHTKLYEQYQSRSFDYPLPLLANFEITYGHRGIGESWKTKGYKQIKLLDHGKELAKRSKK